jgi:uncharacterized membrane protein YraQ (UPF0718 family)
VALGLRRSGCSIGTSLAFWLGNPILNPSTMIFMGFVLGWRWVGLRLVVGVALVFVVAYLVQRLVRDDELTTAAPAIAGSSDAGPKDVPPSKSIWTEWLRELWRLSLGLIPEYVVLVLLLGAARAWLFPTVTPSADGVLWTIGLAVAGMVFVIPTAGEIPIVQTLMSYGLGVGPAAALMTTLPPVSLPSLAMVAKVFPLKIVFALAMIVVALGLLSGAAAVLLNF